MKKLLIAGIVLACAVLIYSFTNSAPATGQVVMVRGVLVIQLAGKDASTVKVYGGTDPAELIQLDKITDKATFDAAVNKVMETVNKLVSEGYKVVGSTEIDGASSVVFNYTLSK